MKLLSFICIVLYSIEGHTQNVELSGGLNRNKFYDCSEGEGHFTSSYTPATGFYFGLDLDSIRAEWMTLNFSLTYESYSGSLDVYTGGLGGGYNIIADVEKSLISLGISPIHFNLGDKFYFDLGIQFSKLVANKFSGSISRWSYGGGLNGNYNLADEHSKYHAPTNFGLRAKLRYSIKLNDCMSISPQYNFYIGLSKEFIEFPTQTKSIRHLIGIGIKKKINCT